ncbi:MAG: FkbM family methyltransferase [Chloroflexaceae bacterium]|nr:FkbM family methyltransferase [Chloroflexaceae bacterium]
MNHPAIQLYHAVARSKHPAPLKLVTTGAYPLLTRALVKLRGQPVTCRAALFFGTTIDVVLPDPVSASIYTYGFYDETVSWLAMKHTRPGDTVLDIGAHIGYLARLLAHVVGPTGSVYAFEPTPRTFALLQRNTRQQRHIVPLNAAAGLRDERLTLHDYGPTMAAWNTLSHQPRWQHAQSLPQHLLDVPVINLDRYLTEQQIRPDLIKIDAEDYEYQIVLGLQQTLQRCHPHIIMEAGSTHTLNAGHLLLDLGYHCFISCGLGHLMPWYGPLAEANATYKDLLFCHPHRAD